MNSDSQWQGDLAMRNIIKIWMLSFLALGVLSLAAETIRAFVDSPQVVVRDAHDIVEGEVIYVVEPKRPFFTFKRYACVGSLYKLKVANSLKGKYQVGEVIEVGVNRQGQSVMVGEKQLAFINIRTKEALIKSQFLSPNFLNNSQFQVNRKNDRILAVIPIRFTLNLAFGQF